MPVCGNCKKPNATVEEIRACYAGTSTSFGTPGDGTNPLPAKRTPVTEDGMYRHGGTIYKVQKAVSGSGHLYAKRLVIEIDLDQDDAKKGRFEYEPGAINKIAAQDRMTLEAAKEFGKLYGVCCECGRILTDENSIAEGIGPICAGKGWWK